MKKIILLMCSVIVLLMPGCGPASDALALTMVAQTDVASTLKAVAMPTDTPMPTEKPTEMPTKTPTPTKTKPPTKTPNIALTQQFDDFYSLLESFEGRGYVDTSNGEAIILDPFKQDWAQMDWFQWWSLDLFPKDFLYKGHFEWSNASSTPEESACGIVFGIQENGDYYVVFLGTSRILFMMKRGSTLHEVGKTRGAGRTDFDTPAEAEFVLAVKDQKAYVSVDGEMTEYTLSVDQTTEGNFAYSLLSGTNKDYGTRCEITDSMIWISE